MARLRNLIFDADNPIVLGGRPMALHRRKAYPRQGGCRLARGCRPEDQPGLASPIAVRLDDCADRTRVAHTGVCVGSPEATRRSRSRASAVMVRPLPPVKLPKVVLISIPPVRAALRGSAANA